MYFRLGFSHRFTSPILLYIVGKMTGIDFSCSDMHWTPKEWTSWLDINDNSFKLTWNGNTFKLQLHESKIFRDGSIFCSLFLSAEYVVNLANMVIWYDDDDMMMMMIDDDDDDEYPWKNCANHTVLRETSSKFASCQNRVDSTWRACHGLLKAVWPKQAPVETILSDYIFCCAVLF